MAELIIGWFAKYVRRYWITAGIFLTLVSTVLFSLDRANWVTNDAPLSFAFLLGLVFGWLLASSRFGWPFALFYALFVSIVIPIEAIGRIIPALGTMFGQPLAATADGMNLRAWELSLRVTGWIDTLRSGDNIKDNGLFFLLIGAVLALCGIWLMWSIIRQRRAINGLLPVAFLLALNIHLSHQSLTNYAVFLLCGLLLIARTSFNRTQEDWDRRRVDYPDQIGIEWSGSAMVLAMSIVIVARLLPYLGTPEGWRAVADYINSYHQQTSDTATRLFSGVNPPPPQPGMKPQVKVNTPNMSQIGAPISQGTEVIMWVRLSDPPPLPPEVGAHMPETIGPINHYWRSGIYGAYTGRGWQPAPVTAKNGPQPALPKEPPPGRYYLRQEFELEAKHTTALFSVSNPVQTDQNAHLSTVVEGDSQLVEGLSSKYQVITEATQVTSNELASAPVDYPPEISATYLQLPDSLPGRVRVLARRLAAGQDDPYHKALAIQTYLRDNFKYDLAAPAAPKNRDVVDYFLFDTQTGFCSHYASAMVVMLRSVGVPARVATGYAMGGWDTSKAAYRVIESEAHAWVEVYFPGYGWVEFEPTTVRSAITYPEAKATVAGNSNLNTVSLDNPKFEATPFLQGLVIVAALALLALPFFLMQMFSTPHKSPVVAVDVLYRRMRRVLAWAGLSAEPSLTPDEYLARYKGQLHDYEQLSRALVQATTLYRETVYSPRPPDEMRIRKADYYWRQSFNEWVALWARARWRKIRRAGDGVEDG